MRSLRHKLIALLVLGIGGALGAWSYVDDGHSHVAYQTAGVERGSLARLVTATGTVNPVTIVQVGTYVSGPIKALFVDFNSSVKQGQRVAQIDPRPFIVKVKQAEANLLTARAQVERDKADLDFKQRVLTRFRRLLERNLIAKQEVEAAERDAEQAQAQLQLDQALVAQHTAALEEAKVNLDYTDITSPVDGVVVARNVNVGQTVAASFQTPVLFLIAQDLTKMQVNTNVSESDIGIVHEGQRASFTVDAYLGRKFWGMVTQVRNAPQTVQNVVTYDVIVSVDNTDLALKPGMTASLAIISAQRDNVLKVPLAALRFHPPSTSGNGKRGGQALAAQERGGVQATDGREDEKPRQVWVRADGQGLKPVPVQVGISDETYAELVQGALTEGDKVVTGISTTSDGASRLTLPGFIVPRRR
jgi:HlyD family secretion protein